MYDRMQTFTQQELETLHKASLRILEKNGISFQEEETISLFKDKGFCVENSTVFFTPDDVDKAIESTPSSFTLHARNPENTLHVGGDDWVVLPTLGAPFVAELDGSQRPGTMADYDIICKLVQTSKHVGMCGFKHVEPSDVDTNTAYLDMLYSNIILSDKPFMGSTDTVCAAEDTMKMAAITFGGHDKIQDTPVTIGLINPLSPLQYAEEMAGSIRIYASAGQPVIIVNMIMGGTSGPVSLPGMLALMNAEILAGIVLAQLVNKGTPVVYGTTSCPTNMRSGAATIGSPETYKINSAVTQLARHYNLPCRTGGSLTDALIPDAQALAEGALCLSTSIRNGANFILHACGMIGTYIAMNFEKWLIDEELCGIVREMLQPITISDETIDVDTILSVGAGGNYLTAPSTLKNCRTAFYENALYNKADHNQWKNSGGLSVALTATDRLAQRLATYETPAIPPDIESTLSSFLSDRKERRN